MSVRAFPLSQIGSLAEPSVATTENARAIVKTRRKTYWGGFTGPLRETNRSLMCQIDIQSLLPASAQIILQSREASVDILVQTSQLCPGSVHTIVPPGLFFLLFIRSRHSACFMPG
jgi:hypothetical protein